MLTLFQNALAPNRQFYSGLLLVVRNEGTSLSLPKGVVLRIGVSARLSETHPVKRRNDSQPSTPLGCGVGTKLCQVLDGKKSPSTISLILPFSIL